MKKILKTADGNIFGPFTTIEKVDNGYLADNISYQTLVVGDVVIEEVANDYVIPNSNPISTGPSTLVDALKTGA